MRKTRLYSVAVAMLLLTASILSGHSFAAFFDGQRPFSVTGTITRADWVMPEVFIHVRVDDKTTGKSKVWAFEALGPRVMSGAYHLSESMFKEGQTITVIGWPEKPGANLAGSITNADLSNRVRSENAACAAQFEFADGQKFPVVAQVPAL